LGLALVLLVMGMVRDLRCPLVFLYWFEDGFAASAFGCGRVVIAKVVFDAFVWAS